MVINLFIYIYYVKNVLCFECMKVISVFFFGYYEKWVNVLNDYVLSCSFGYKMFDFVFK